YEGAKGKPTSKAYPLNNSEECRDVNPNSLSPLSQLKPPQKVAYKFDLTVGFIKTPTTGDVGAINNSSFVASLNFPSNRRIINGVDPYTFPQYENAYVYGSNTTNSNYKDSAIDLYIINKTPRSHPFHL
ncbi:7068_t:CDS:2, partial [Scutellospora calospora]